MIVAVVVRICLVTQLRQCVLQLLLGTLQGNGSAAVAYGDGGASHGGGHGSAAVGEIQLAMFNVEHHGVPRAVKHIGIGKADRVVACEMQSLILVDRRRFQRSGYNGVIIFIRRCDIDDQGRGIVGVVERDLARVIDTSVGAYDNAIGIV